MGKISRKAIATVLASVWALCILHCLSDQATAHWHQLPSGKFHHHHHSIPESGHSDSHEHGEPQNGHSHDKTPGGYECCAVKARISAPSLADRLYSYAEAIGFNNSYSAVLTATPVGGRALNEPRPKVPDPESFSEVSSRIRTLISPNAPPSTRVC